MDALVVKAEPARALRSLTVAIQVALRKLRTIREQKLGFPKLEANRPMAAFETEIRMSREGKIVEP